MRVARDWDEFLRFGLRRPEPKLANFEGHEVVGATPMDFAFCRDRPERRFLRRPTLKLALHRPRLQRHANAIACLQPREGLPVVPVLSEHRYGKHA